MKLLISAMISAVCVLNSAAGSEKPKEELPRWERFLKYDLCIEDYDSRPLEERQMIRYAYTTEQAFNDDIVMERSRRIAAGDDVGERITLEQLENAYGIWDSHSRYNVSSGWHFYIDAVPDVIYLKYEWENDYHATFKQEYWLDDDRSSYVVFREKTSADSKARFEVYDSEDELIKTIPVAYDCPMKDFRGEAEEMEAHGFIEKNGAYYYTKPDGTAVFAWSGYTKGNSSEKITEPFVVESEINGCPVTAIEHAAFAASPFTEIVLPDSIEVIDTLAFTDCQYLEKINFPEKLEYIGRLAFYACNSMTEVNIDCPELVLSRDCFTESKGLVSANINAKEIGERAFSSCKSLNSITLGNDVKKIDCQAFWGDFSVPEITIPGSVKAIGQNAFGGIRSVKLSVYPKILGAYPYKTTEILLSGLQPPPPVRPLQDDPQCVFDEDCTVYGYTGTSDEKYADEWELNFVPLDYLKGDVNFDGEFNVADVVTVNSFMHGSKDQEIVYWKAADVCEDDVIDIFDLLKLKEDLVRSNEKPVTN